MFRLVRTQSNIVGYGYHRSGWPMAVAALRRYDDAAAPLILDDFPEQRFIYRHPVLLDRPWVGIWHHPPDVPHWTGTASHGLARVFARADVRETMATMRGVIALSEHLAAFVREHVRCPVTVLTHPTATDVPMWDASSLANPRLLQVGHYLRNVRAIHAVAVSVSGWRCVRRLPNTMHVRNYDRLCREHYGTEDSPLVATEWGRIGNADYDRELATSVVLTDLVAASANNVLVECLARATPLIVNRIPPVVEYLGQEYPLYYDSLADVPRLLDDARLLAAHDYLRERSKEELLPEHFARHVVDFCLSVRP